MDEKHKPGWGFWTTATLIALAIYPLSFGPACWLNAKNPAENGPNDPFSAVYRPIGWIALHGPAPLPSVVCWYAGIGIRRNHGTVLVVETKNGGHAIVFYGQK